MPIFYYSAVALALCCCFCGVGDVVGGINVFRIRGSPNTQSTCTFTRQKHPGNFLKIISEPLELFRAGLAYPVWCSCGAKLLVEYLGPQRAPYFAYESANFPRPRGISKEQYNDRNKLFPELERSRHWTNGVKLQAQAIIGDPAIITCSAEPT